jgi:integrase
MIESDPTQAVKRPRAKTEHRRAWLDSELEQYERTHPIGSEARLAFALGFHTVQRLGDVVRMAPQHFRNGRLEIRQNKTGTAVSVPITSGLQTVLDATPRENLKPYLLKDSGNAYAAGELSAKFRKWSNEAGLPQGCTFHGLRSTGCTRFAEAGCTAHEIAAWSGHKSLQQVEGYTRSANQKRLADAALARIANK